MSYDIAAIDLVDKEFDRYSVSKSASNSKRLAPLSKFNIFVGENNSGKSSFLRLLSCQPKLTFLPNDDRVKLAKLEELRGRLRELSQEQFENGALAPYGSVKKVLINGPNFCALEEKSEKLRAFDSELANLSRLLADPANHPGLVQLLTSRPLVSLVSELRAAHDKATALGINYIKEPYAFTKVYIPTLRGLRTISLERDVYQDRTKRDYFPEDVPNQIFTGQEFYKEIKRLLLGNLANRKKVQDFERKVSEWFFDGRPLAIIPRDDEGQDVVDIKIGDEEQRPIYQLGDGVQAVLIMLFPLFAHKRQNLLMFLDEPELHMHPGLQRKFLRVLSQIEGAQFFLTTHSNHFLDLTLDFPEVSVFTFHKTLEDSVDDEKRAKFHIENVSSENRRPLELLGVRNSSVLLSNCTIWVEGVTDRRYLAHYLELYQDKHTVKGQGRFQEDLHFSFVEYGGGNITHWSFLDEENGIDVQKLCSRLFLIADADDEASMAKSERHTKLSERLGERFYRLPCREIENLLSPAILKMVVVGYEGDDSHVPEVAYDEYRNEPLGDFIEDTWLQGIKKRRGKYREDSGTVSQKSDFCEKAISAIKLWNDLSPEAQELTKAIYDFIAGNNDL